MKKIGNLVLCGAFFLLCFLLPAAGILVKDQADTSEENRTLSQFPKVESLSDLEHWPKQFEDWYSDHMFLKSFFVEQKSRLEIGLFHQLDSEKVVLGTQKPWLFHCSNDGQPMETYKKTNLFTEEELQEIGENLQAFQNDLKKEGISFILMIAPDKEQIYGEDYLPEEIRVKEGPGRTEQLLAYLEETAPALPVVYPRKQLEMGKELLSAQTVQPDGVSSLYYESDTHWNQAGAAVAAASLMETVSQVMKEGEDSEDQNVLSEEQIVKNIERFQKNGTVRGDLQKLVKLGEDYNSTEYLPQSERRFQVKDLVSDQNEEVIWEHSESREKDCLPVSLYLTGDSFRWNLADELKADTRESVISSRYYFMPEDVMEQKSQVLVYLIAERYLHELSMIPGYNTVALQMP